MLSHPIAKERTRVLAGKQSGLNIHSSRLPHRAFLWILSVFLFLLLQSFIPISKVVQIGADEGFELAKATLLLNGHGLYSGAWNDQPAFHTALIAQTLEHISPSVMGPRLITSFFTVLMLISLFYVSVRICGPPVATILTTLLIASPGFLELSSSCMLEIPALAMAMASFDVIANLRKERWYLFAIPAGIFFGLSLSIKLIALVLMPIALLLVWVRFSETEVVVSNPPRDRQNGSPQRQTDRKSHSFLKSFDLFVVTWAFVAGLTFVAVDLLIDGGAFLKNFQQSWSSHFGRTKSFEYGSPGDHPFDWSILLKNWDMTVPAIIGICCCVAGSRRNKAAVFPIAWLAFALLVFSIHKPWWNYYYIHIAIPLCLCAGIGIQESLKRLRKEKSVALKTVAGFFAVCAIGWMTSRVYLQISDIRHLPQLHSSLILKEIERYKKDTRYLYADEPIYSFHAGIPMPPNLAVVPLKRLWSGDMTNERIAAELSAVKPELIMIKNDTVERPFSGLLSSEYRMVYEDHRHRLFVLRTAKRK